MGGCCSQRWCFCWDCFCYGKFPLFNQAIASLLTVKATTSVGIHNASLPDPRARKPRLVVSHRPNQDRISAVDSRGRGRNGPSSGTETGIDAIVNREPTDYIWTEQHWAGVCICDGNNARGYCCADLDCQCSFLRVCMLWQYWTAVGDWRSQGGIEGLNARRDFHKSLAFLFFSFRRRRRLAFLQGVFRCVLDGMHGMGSYR